MDAILLTGHRDGRLDGPLLLVEHAERNLACARYSLVAGVAGLLGPPGEGVEGGGDAEQYAHHQTPDPLTHCQTHPEADQGGQQEGADQPVDQLGIDFAGDLERFADLPEGAPVARIVGIALLLAQRLGLRLLLRSQLLGPLALRHDAPLFVNQVMSRTHDRAASGVPCYRLCAATNKRTPTSRGSWASVLVGLPATQITGRTRRRRRPPRDGP